MRSALLGAGLRPPSQQSGQLLPSRALGISGSASLNNLNKGGGSGKIFQLKMLMPETSSKLG